MIASLGMQGVNKAVILGLVDELLSRKDVNICESKGEHLWVSAEGEKALPWVS